MLDLQARPEHRMVLQPNASDSPCGLTLEYALPAGPGAAPSLLVQLANPRLLLLARFAADVLHGVAIIRAGVSGSALAARLSGRSSMVGDPTRTQP